MTNRILVADDDNAIRLVLQQALTREGFQVRATSNVATLAKWASDGEGDLIVTDVYMGDACVFDALPAIRSVRPGLPIIVMSAQSTVATAMSAASAGAYDYLPKPFDLDDLVGLARRALSQQPTAKARAAAAVAEKDARLPMVGRSAAMQELYKAMARAASTDLPTLISGEPGVGKERIARAIHAHGRRSQRPFVVWPLAGEGGHVAERAPTLVSTASGGTLYLDGLDQLNLEGREALVRVLDSFERERPDARLIASVGVSDPSSADRPMQQILQRLTVLSVHAPPLRAHLEDIGDIARALLAQAKFEGLPEKTLDASAIDRLQSHSWPGNVRELWNLLRRLSVMRPERVLTAADIESELSAPVAASAPAPSAATLEDLLAEQIGKDLANPNGQPGLYDRLLARVEKPLLEKTLQVTRGNQIRAAAILGINRNTLRKKILALGVATGKSD